MLLWYDKRRYIKLMYKQDSMRSKNCKNMMTSINELWEKTQCIYNNIYMEPTSWAMGSSQYFKDLHCTCQQHEIKKKIKCKILIISITTFLILGLELVCNYVCRFGISGTVIPSLFPVKRDYTIHPKGYTNRYMLTWTLQGSPWITKKTSLILTLSLSLSLSLSI